MPSDRHTVTDGFCFIRNDSFMTSKRKKPPVKGKQKRDSVVTEAWDNMNEDLARVLPSFISDRLQGGKNKLWLMIIITVVELVVLGVIVKLVYDWFIS